MFFEGGGKTPPFFLLDDSTYIKNHEGLNENKVCQGHSSIQKKF